MKTGTSLKTWRKICKRKNTAIQTQQLHGTLQDHRRSPSLEEGAGLLEVAARSKGKRKGSDSWLLGNGDDLTASMILYLSNVLFGYGNGCHSEILHWEAFDTMVRTGFE